MIKDRAASRISRLALRLAPVLVGAAALSSLALWACGSESTPVPDADGGSSGSSGSSGTSGTSGSSGTPGAEDAGVLGDGGCPVVKVGPFSGKVAVNVTRDGIPAAVAWETPDNARESDLQFTKITLDDGQESQLLRITNFGISSVPSNAEIQGFSVEMKRQSESGGIMDGLIELTYGGNRVSGRPKYFETPWPRTQLGTHNYGQAIDRWGNDVFPNDVKSPEFGVEIWTKRNPDAGAGAVSGVIDSLRITVYYCAP